MAVVTGASAGIGADIVKQLACRGVIVVGLARRKERVDELAKQVGNKGKIHSVKCDISDEERVAEAFEWVDKNLGAISILINNAGIVRSVNFQGETNFPERPEFKFCLSVRRLEICSSESP